MPVHNAEVAACFNRMAELLEIEGANPFRIRAYRRAASTIEDLPSSVAAMVAESKDVDSLPGIGEDLAAKIAEIVETGHLRALEEVEARTPSTLAALTSIPGLGPKRVHVLHDALGVRTVEDLLAAATAGRIRELPRFSAATEKKIIDEIRKHRETEQRFRLSTAEDFAAGLVGHLRRAPGIRHVVVAGSFRRRRETVGDLDILVTGEGRASRHRPLRRLRGGGRGRCRRGPRAPRSCWPRACRSICAWCRRRATARRSTTSPGRRRTTSRSASSGRRAGSRSTNTGSSEGGKRIGGRTEEEVFARGRAALHRAGAARGPGRDRGRAARSRCRSWSRSRTCAATSTPTPRPPTARARCARWRRPRKARGYAYLAITDHSQHATIAHGLDAKRLAAQLDEIDRLNDRLEGIRILKACEVDILEDGTLDLPDTILSSSTSGLRGALPFDLDREAPDRADPAGDGQQLFQHPRPPDRAPARRAPGLCDRPRAGDRGAKERGMLPRAQCASRAGSTSTTLHCRHGEGPRRSSSRSRPTPTRPSASMPCASASIRPDAAGWSAEDVLNTRPWSELRKLLVR